MVAEKLDSESGEVWYSFVDMTYAYGQVPVQLLTAKPCYFRIIGCKIYRKMRICNTFSRPDGYADRISKRILILAKFGEVFVFIDDNLIVIKGT